jgi:hypothetical protein
VCDGIVYCGDTQVFKVGLKSLQKRSQYQVVYVDVAGGLIKDHERKAFKIIRPVKTFGTVRR